MCGAMDEVATQRWEQMWLPLWPLASDDLLSGLYRGSRERALGKRYIEANPQAVSNLLVVDVDHGDAALRVLGTRPLPHVIVENPTNGHAHAVWALREPVTRTEYARRKPLAYAASVTEGLRRAVDGDKSYSGLITKNPTHKSWIAQSVADPETLYSLDQLRDGLGDAMPPERWMDTKARRAAPIGLGRNCSLFKTARTWAYREIRHHWGDSPGLARAIHAQSVKLNAEFPEPLPASEVRAMASSIHRWIVTRSRMWADGPAVYEATFTTIQSARGVASGVARRARRDERIEEMRE
ncbi:replication initiation protein [uncultured Corynebacterium sp.]|uniref:replication initiation protein n=1 Tax=uncultured Corynebacterium sp. TaxID=159447 RepID=UPI0025DC0D7D|nr:replication initiation protein [uncultured Corynebacterium sp.]